MAGYGVSGAETPLVSALVRAGIRHGRAVAFERALDDHPFCGISGTMLGALIAILVAESAGTPTPPKSCSATSMPAGAVPAQQTFEYHRDRLAKAAIRM